MEEFKKYALRAWNTIKIPLFMFIILLIADVLPILREGGVEALIDSKIWIGFINGILIFSLPAIAGALDKYLRDQGVYIERIFTGFKLPE